MAPLKVIVVGAGPVGALAALYAAKRGHTVEVYEMRSDLRDPETVPLNFTKSINLALSERGINSLRSAHCEGLLEAIIDDTIPMYGRMIHGIKDGKLYEQAQNYDVHGRFIRAADRAALNKRLLDELDRMSNVTLHFSHKLTGADFANRRAWFEQKDGDTPYSKSPSERAREIEVAFNLMIGADGAHSAVRFHIMKFSRVNYQQEYIDTLWCEFHMPPATDAAGNAAFALSPHHLHIWPAGSFMFIAIPSQDKSFTCTLFMPAHRFEAIDAAPETLVPFFDKNFPGVSARIAPKALLRQYTANPHLPLISIKCNPYHYGGSAVFVGDAAHAMVPFYGQGMNAGLEDVRVLFDVWDTKLGEAQLSLPFAKPLDHSLPVSEPLLEAILSQYTAQRMPDAHTINDLAMRNYGEMRSDVRSPVYLLRKRVEEFLDCHAPSLGFTTQYARISFSNQPYSQVADAIRRQTSSLHVAAGVVAAVMGTGAALAWTYMA